MGMSFKQKQVKKIVAHNYSNVNLRLSNIEGNITILTITNVNQVLQLGHNLLKTITLAKKGIEIFLKKNGLLFEIIADNKVFELANIIENQYVIQLAKSSKFAIIK